MSLAKRSIRGFLWNHLTRILDYGLGYLLAIVLARKLGATEYGTYVTLLSIVSLSLIIGSVGFDETLNKFVSQLFNTGRVSQLRFLIRRLITIRIVVVCLICAGLYLFRTSLNQIFQNELIDEYIFILIFYILAQSLVNFFINVWTAQLKTRFVFVVNTLAKVFTITGVLYLLNEGSQLQEIFLWLSIVSLISVGVYIVGSRSMWTGQFERNDLSPVFRFSIATWINAILALTIGRYSVILLIGYFHGTSAQSSYYDIAFSLTLLIEYVFAVGFVGVSLSVFSELVDTNRALLASARSAIMKYHQVFIFPASIFCLVYPDFIITQLFSEQYLPAVPLFRIYLSFNLVAVSLLGSGTSVGILLALGEEKIVVLNRTIMGSMNLFANILVIPQYGATGAITISGIIILLTFLIEFILSSRRIGLQYDYIFTMKVIGVSVLSIIVVNLLGSILSLSSFMCAFLYVCTVVFGYFIVRLVDKSPKEIFDYLGIQY